MHILQVHNFYQLPGGEDQVFSAESKLLTAHGHSVEQYAVRNEAVNRMNGIDVAVRTLWNPETYRDIRRIIQSFRPQVIHAHNTFPLVSPSLYYAAAAENVPVVQTLHNFRLICPSATLYRDGRVCEDCLKEIVPYSGVLHSCYRGNRLASATVAAMLATHRLAHTWRSKIHTYIALTDFARRKLIEGGLPEEKIVIKSNFVSTDPGPGTGNGDYVLYLGRLSEEKGLRTLLHAWEQLPGIPLKIAGDGPLRDLVVERAGKVGNVTWLGHCNREQVTDLLQKATALIVPSEWYESAVPLNIIDATACGTPVVCTDLGSLREWAGDIGSPRFASGDPKALAQGIKELISRPEALAELRVRMRTYYQTHYTADENYRTLQTIYRRAIDGKRS